jgi:hypothetical protein
MVSSRLSDRVILWLQGGLGNQLFQYSAMKQLTEACGLELGVSRSSFWRDGLRSYDLRPLVDNREALCLRDELCLGWPYNLNGSIRERAFPSGRQILYADEDSDDPVLEPGLLVVGFFQRPTDMLRSTAAVTAKLRLLRENLVQSSSYRAVLSSGTVAHVRRGDYVSGAAAARFGKLTRRYYQSAFEELNVEASDVVFFTDDVEFVRSEFGVSSEQIVGPRSTKTDLEALLLMACANRFVIPNSTFSWWSAEVSGSDSVVCAPCRWFTDSDRTLARSTWRLIPNA